MPTSFSQVNVFNMALDILRETPVSSLDDANAVARWGNRNFAVSRDALLESYYWKFAIDRDELAADATAPEFDWTYRYELPTDCLQLLPLREDGKWEGNPILHEVENNFILTNASGPLKVRYIGRRDDPGTWSNLFCTALACDQAYRMAHWLTGKANYVEIAEKAFNKAMVAAKRANALLGTAQRADQSEIIGIRG